jgi:DNA polymerase III subunit delta
VSEVKPCYLVYGDDDVKLDSWRRRLRARAEEEGPSTTLEVLKDEKLTGETVASVLSSMTLSVGRRYVLADGVERWKDRDVQPVAAALGSLGPETVVVFIAQRSERDRQSGKRSAVEPPARLVKAVKAAGGEVTEYAAPRGAGYPRWIAERGRELGVTVTREGAQALLELVGPNQRRLLRELEKLSAFVGAGDGAEDTREVGLETVEALASSAVEARTYELADAVIDADAERALRLAEELRARGEDLMYILFALRRAIGHCHRAWVLTASGGTVSDVQSDLRVPSYVAKRVVAQARRTDGERIEEAIDLLAELDWAIRGGAGSVDPESALTLTLTRASAGA